MLRLAALLTLTVLAPAQTPSAGYDQPFRPQVHFSPQRNWMNDPNGPIFFAGEYHLFFQYNPQGMVPGHISWGHAVSPDLLHWHELPVAIPEADGAQVFTGSVVIDQHNTSGLCANNKPCMIAIYTANRGSGSTQQETQEIASSQDRGRTWQRFAGNPVLDLHLSDFRDPAVSWNDQTHSWLMVVSLPNEHQVLFYTSPNLKQWTRISTFGPAATVDGQWECPDLVQVPSANGRETLWALKVGLNPGSLQGGSGEQYFLGSFDGKHFTQSSDPGSHGWTDYGKDSYCAVSYNHLPPGERPTLIGWMNNWQYADKLPTSPWRGQMTLPRRVTLLHDATGLALIEDPVVAPLRIGPGTPIHLDATANTPVLTTTAPAEITLNFTGATDATTLGVRLFSDPTHYTDVGFDRTRHTLFVDRTHSGDDVAPGFLTRTEAPLADGRPLNLHLILDRASLEVFAQNGTLAMTNLLFPRSTSVRVLPLRESGSEPLHLAGRSWQLRSIWTPSTP